MHALQYSRTCSGGSQSIALGLTLPLQARWDCCVLGLHFLVLGGLCRSLDGAVQGR